MYKASRYILHALMALVLLTSLGLPAPVAADERRGHNWAVRNELHTRELVARIRYMMNAHEYPAQVMAEAIDLEAQARKVMAQGLVREAEEYLGRALGVLQASLDNDAGTGGGNTDITETPQSDILSLDLESTEAIVYELVLSSGYSRDAPLESSILTVPRGTAEWEIGELPLLLEARECAPVPSGIDRQPESPFGVSIAGFLQDHQRAIGYIDDLSMGWVRFMSHWGGLVWDLVEPEPGRYDWSESDRLYDMAHREGLNIMANIYPANGWDNPNLDLVDTSDGSNKLPAAFPNDLEAYLDFVRAAAERYDADGIADAPDSPHVRAWIIGTEMEAESRWMDTPENYARLFIESYKAIKEADPSAEVLVFGSNIYLSNLRNDIDSFTLPALAEIRRLADEEGIENFRAPFGVHHYQEDPQLLIKSLLRARALADEAGFHEADMPLWITDMATFIPLDYASQGREGFDIERQEAADMIRMFAVALGHGVENAVWAQISDGVRPTQMESGFIGQDPDSSNQRDHFAKLSYDSFERLVSLLVDTDWEHVSVLRDGAQGDGGVYLYAFPDRDGCTTRYVAWKLADAEGGL